MTMIRVAQDRNWTKDLTNALGSAGFVVTGDGTADIAFADVCGEAIADAAATILVASESEIVRAISRVKAGEAYAFIRMPLVEDEATVLVARTIEHMRLAREVEELRHHVTGDAAFDPANADVSSNTVAVARNLAGKPLADIEKQVILSTLEQFKGHRVRTATALGIGVRTLGMKLKRWREEGEPIVTRSVPRPPAHAAS